MKKKTGLLILVFVAFYTVIHLSRYLPDLINGRFSLVDERSDELRLVSMMVEFIIAWLFTFSTYLSLHRLYPRKQYVRLLAVLAGCFLTCFALQYLAAKLLSADPVRLSGVFRTEILYDGFYVVFAMIFFFVRFSQFNELQQKERSLQMRNAELSFLRSQINPHFLFNNLNNIYSLVYHQSPQSLAAISSLSELLRYMLYDKSETITLEEEIQYLKKYIALEQLRFEHPCKIEFNYNLAAPHTAIAPLMLIPFIENAFKHGAISFDKCWLRVDLLTTAGGEITLNCMNLVGTKRKDPTGGIGISNVRKRLELIYPNAHELQIREEEDKFKISLHLHKLNTAL